MVGVIAGSQLVIIVPLIALNAVLYIPLGYVLLRRRTRRVKAKNLAEAFDGLQVALKQAVPDLPAGFTWGEALARLRSAGVWTNEMENALKSYEDYRYGGSPLSNVDFDDVVMVANMLGGIDPRRGGASSLG